MQCPEMTFFFVENVVWTNSICLPEGAAPRWDTWKCPPRTNGRTFNPYLANSVTVSLYGILMCQQRSALWSIYFKTEPVGIIQRYQIYRITTKVTIHGWIRNKMSFQWNFITTSVRNSKEFQKKCVEL